MTYYLLLYIFNKSKIILNAMKNNITPIINFTFFELSFLDISQAPKSEPAIEPIAHQDNSVKFILPIFIRPKNPERDENITIKAVVADAFLGLIPIQTKTGTIILPPPTPNNPPTNPANEPIPNPYTIAFFVSVSTLLYFAL